MNGTAAMLAALVLLVAGVAAPVGGSTTEAVGAAEHAAQAETVTPGPNESAEQSAPGAHLAGVVDVQEAEVESDLEGRAFGIRVARANSNESKAAVVAEQVDELERRTDELRERKRSLIEARNNGSISQARFRAEVAALAARTASVERHLNRTEAASGEIPADHLESRGVNASAIERLRNDSRDLAGPEVADIARTIAGPPNRGGLGAGNGTGLGAANATARGSPGGPDTPNGSGPPTSARPGSTGTGSGGQGPNAPVTNPGRGGGPGGDGSGGGGPGGPPGG